MMTYLSTQEIIIKKMGVIEIVETNSFYRVIMNEENYTLICLDGGWIYGEQEWKIN